MNKILVLDHLDNMLGISLVPGHQVGRVVTQQPAIDILSHYNLIRSIHYPEEKIEMKIIKITLIIIRVGELYS